jgi:nitroreductase
MKNRPHYDYPIDEILQKRWSPRAFADKPLTEEQVLTLLEAARWSASCNNSQPWRFIWSQNDGSELYEKLFACLNPRNQEWVGTAPVLMMTLSKIVFELNGQPDPWAIHDLGLAMGNLTTQATLMDIFVHSMGGFSVEKARELFVIPEGVEPITMVAIGYLGDLKQLSEFNQKREADLQSRKPLSELMIKIEFK